MSTTHHPDNDKSATSHSWENIAGHIWQEISEDADGNILTGDGSNESLSALIRKRRRLLRRRDYAQSSRRIVRDMIRYLYLVVDLSRSMWEKDLLLSQSKTRAEVLLKFCLSFVDDYFDQNPLSHLGIVICCDGEAELLTQLSGSPRVHKVALEELLTDGRSGGSGEQRRVVGGEFSLQNGLEVAGRSLGHMPLYGSREVFLLMAALSTCDPGDVLVETFPKLMEAKIRVSCVSVAAEMYVCRRLAEGTGGIMGVCLDLAHLRDLIMGQCKPPPKVTGDENDVDDENGGGGTGEFVRMGFPKRECRDVPSLIHATRDKKMFAVMGYICPRCNAKVSDLPTDCIVCGLKLVLAPHLARSFHHLFPVPPFHELPSTSSESEMPKPDEATSSSSSFAPDKIVSSFANDDNNNNNLTSFRPLDDALLVSSKSCDMCCYGCMVDLSPRWIKKVGKKEELETPLRLQCPECRNVFCADCDVYLHETLHNCPGCLCQS